MATMIRAYATHAGPPGIGAIILPVAPLSTEQYLRMIDAGIFDSSERVELINGYITPKHPPKPGSVDCHFMLAALFAPYSEKFAIAVQATVVINEGQILDPGFALLRHRADDCMTELPRAADVLLLVESVASSSKGELGIKLPIYAAAEIPEYWIVDFNDVSLEVYREPVGEIYTYHQKLDGDDVVSPLACPEVALCISSLFD